MAILNHGSPSDSAKRPTVVGFNCASEAVRWFLAQGYLVVAPVRRGYGATGGAWSEDYGSCQRADYVHAGLETARDIQATVAYAASLPGALPDHMVVVGQSGGGWGTIAYNSSPHPQVSAVINMAGGRGGHHHGKKLSNCRPDLLIDAAGIYGKTASAPILWMYAANDTFFPPDLVKGMYDAYTRAGGKAEYAPGRAFGDEGHEQFTTTGGSKIWGPVFTQYLAEY